MCDIGKIFAAAALGITRDKHAYDYKAKSEARRILLDALVHLTPAVETYFYNRATRKLDATGGPHELFKALRDMEGASTRQEAQLWEKVIEIAEGMFVACDDKAFEEEAEDG